MVQKGFKLLMQKKKKSETKIHPNTLFGSDFCLDVRLSFRKKMHALDGDLWALSVLWLEVHEDLQNGLSPVRAVGEQTQIRQRLLRSARLPFHLRELITSQPNIQDSSLEQLCLHYPRIILRWQAIILHAL